VSANPKMAFLPMSSQTMKICIVKNIGGVGKSITKLTASRVEKISDKKEVL
jgi:hypothetical protein